MKAGSGQFKQLSTSDGVQAETIDNKAPKTMWDTKYNNRV